MVAAIPEQAVAPIGFHPATPRKAKAGDIDSFFDCMCRDLGIRLPYHDNASPGKRRKSPGHDIVNKATFLFWKDCSALKQAVTELSVATSKLTSRDERLTLVLERLHEVMDTVKSRATSLPASRTLPVTTSMAKVSNETLKAAFAPPSPTMNIKHAPTVGLGVANPIHLPQPRQDVSFSTTSDCSAPTSDATKISQDTAFTSFDSRLDGPSDDPGTQSYSTPDESVFRGLEQDQQQSAHPLAAAPAVVIMKEPHKSREDPKRTFRVAKEINTKRNILPQLREFRKTGVAKQFSGANGKPGDFSNLSKTAVAPNAMTDKNTSTREPRPPLVNYRIKNMPSDGFTRLKLLHSFLSLRFDLRWEAIRVFQTERISQEELLDRWRFPRSMASLHALVDELGVPSFQKGFESADLRSVSFCAELWWSSSKEGPLLDLWLLPIRHDEKTSSFQRRFGSDRVVYISTPDFSNIPHGLSKDAAQNSFEDLLPQDHTIAGRTWVQYLVKERSKKKKFGDPDSAKPGTYQLTLFAVDGEDGISPVNIVKFIDWAIPLRENAHQTACKAYSRLDLFSSLTDDLLPLNPQDVIYGAPDKMPDKTPEDSRYNDPVLKFDGNPTSEVMNDGCAGMSLETAENIRKAKGLSIFPSWFQARIAGSKGVWCLDPRLEKKLEITNSQIKVKLKPENFSDDYDREIWTFGGLKWGTRARPSIMHPGFLLILVDRGVPHDAIRQLVRRQVEEDQKELRASLEDPLATRRWLAKHKEYCETLNRVNGIKDFAGFPVGTLEKIILMIESGFRPKECKFLAEQVIALAKKVFSVKRKDFKIRLNMSTTVTGVADPYDCLEPGQVHLLLRTPLEDPVTGISKIMFNGDEAIVGRNPAERPSDLQKVRLVSKAGLSHLQDTAVFSAKGPRPLAGKLQGGDYDGDTFWICFDPAITKFFLNAPAPSSLPAPETLGIDVDTSKLGDIVKIPESEGQLPAEDDVRAWIKANTKVRMSFNMLGIVSTAYERLTYWENSLNSPTARGLIDRKEHLTDADKQGYRYSDSAWSAYRKAQGLQDLAEPAYKRLTSLDADIDEMESKLQKIDFNKENINDQMYFQEIEPGIRNGLRSARDTLMSEAKAFDPDLVRFYDQVYESADKASIIRTVLDSLRTQVTALYRACSGEAGSLANSRMKDKDGNKHAAKWHNIVVRYRARYVAIEPIHQANPAVLEWSRPQEQDLRMWDKLKASAFAKFAHYNGRIMFHIAGKELCRLKASTHPTRVLTVAMYRMLKLSKHEVPLDEVYDADAEEEDAGDGELDVPEESPTHGGMELPLVPSKRKMSDLEDPRMQPQPELLKWEEDTEHTDTVMSSPSDFSWLTGAHRN